MKPKKLSDLIREMINLKVTYGDAYVEVFNDIQDRTVPFILWSEDDKQYYIVAAEETQPVVVPQSDEDRHILSALRSYGDMLGECLTDKALTTEERAAFEKDSAQVELLITMRNPVNGFDSIVEEETI